MDHDARPASDRNPLPAWRAAYLEDVRRRLEEGELDTDTALIETAHALLDGDQPVGERQSNG